MNKIKRTLFGALLFGALLLSGCTQTGNPEAAETAWDDTGSRSGGYAGTDGGSGSNEAQNTAADGLLTVTFLDVGQGNAVLVENDGLYMLIDGGDREYSSYVVSYLQQQGVEELEYVVSSHYDADHLNGIVGALHVFDCELFLAADYTTDTKVYESLLSVIDEKDIPVEYPDMGDTYIFGDAEFTIVCPDDYSYSDDNDNSVGIRLVYGENSFLILGDAGTRVEEMLLQSGLELESDVYLASHHGSAGSSSMAFMEVVNPKAVVISAGLGNSYGHPTEAVLYRVEKMGAQLYRTDLQGEIIVTSDGSNLSWNAAPVEDYRSGDDISVESGKAGSDSVQGSTDTSGNDSIKSDTGASEGAGIKSSTDVNIYVLNLNTQKFHYPSCSSVSDMNEENKAEFEGSREELLEAGYAPCGRCKP